MKIVCKTENDTIKLAEDISLKVGAGNVICLDGDLGAGKTTFTKYLCKEFGVTEYVNSPSYTLVNEYNGDIKINHFDVYRIFSIEEMYEIGFEEYFNNKSLTIVEWAIKIEEILPEDSIWINITLGENYDERIFTIEGLKGDLK